MEGTLKLDPAIVGTLPVVVCVVLYTRCMRAELPREIERRRKNPHEPVRLESDWVERWTFYAVATASGSTAGGFALMALTGGMGTLGVEGALSVIVAAVFCAVIAGLSFGAIQQRHMREMEAEFGTPTFDAIDPHA